MRRARGKPETKLSQLKEAMRAGNWELALRIAARFPRLGHERGAILSGHEAYVNPGFYVQLRKKPAALKEAGKRALIKRYGK